MTDVKVLWKKRGLFKTPPSFPLSLYVTVCAGVLIACPLLSRGPRWRELGGGADGSRDTEDLARRKGV